MILSYLKNIRKEKILFLLVSVLFIILSVIFIFYSEGYATLVKSLDPSETYSLPIEIYYYVQSSFHSIQLTLLLFIATANIFAVDKLIDRQTHFSNMMKCRVNTKKYYRDMLLVNSIFSLIFYVVIQMVIILTLIVLIGPFHFSELDIVDFTTYFNIFSNSTMISFLVYFLFSAIGFVVFSDLIYTLTAWVKNTYIFRGIGIIVGILLSVLPAIIFIFLGNMFSSELFLTIGSPLYLPNLLNPGIQFLGHHMIANSPYITYFVSLLFTSIIVVFLNWRLMIKEHNYD